MPSSLVMKRSRTLCWIPAGTVRPPHGGISEKVDERRSRRLDRPGRGKAAGIIRWRLERYAHMGNPGL